MIFNWCSEIVISTQCMSDQIWSCDIIFNGVTPWHHANDDYGRSYTYLYRNYHNTNCSFLKLATVSAFRIFYRISSYVHIITWHCLFLHKYSAIVTSGPNHRYGWRYLKVFKNFSRQNSLISDEVYTIWPQQRCVVLDGAKWVQKRNENVDTLTMTFWYVHIFFNI